MAALHIDITPEYYQANQRALDEWVAAHGVDKTLVPVRSTIRISQGRVRFEQYAGTEVDPETGDRRRTTVTVKLVRPWPVTE